MHCNQPHSSLSHRVFHRLYQGPHYAQKKRATFVEVLGRRKSRELFLINTRRCAADLPRAANEGWFPGVNLLAPILCPAFPIYEAPPSKNIQKS